MKKVTVSATKEYDVVIGKGLLEDCGKMIVKTVGKSNAAIITDDIVDSIYGEKVEKSLCECGIKVSKFVFKNGEESKNLETYCEILEFLAENKLKRNDIIVALGGGVVGDIAGYAAATYLRGIKFVQIPTTFLAAIDSSVGGKTAVNLKAGKNLAGAFHQPSLVICDTQTLETLSADRFADGAAEAIKYGVLDGEELFEKIASGDYIAEIEDIIAKCVEIKAEVVKNDEFDTGMRQLLNLGHTIGHAIEKCSNFEITHGHAVALGMLYISRAAYKLKLVEKDISDKILNALIKNNLPVSCSFSPEELSEAAGSDKKRNADTINFIIPKDIGDCVIKPLNPQDLLKIISAGM